MALQPEVARGDVVVAMRVALRSRPRHDDDLAALLDRLRGLADFGDVVGLSTGAEAARVDALRARLVQLISRSGPAPAGLVLDRTMLEVVRRVLLGSPIAEAARNHIDDDRVGTKRDYNPQTTRRWIRERAAPLIADWLIARSEGGRTASGTPEVEAVVRSWAVSRSAELAASPAHMRILGVGLDELRQRVHLLDAPASDPLPGEAPSIGWDEILDRAGPHARDRAIIIALPGFGKSTMLTTAALDRYRELSTVAGPLDLAEIAVHLDCVAIDRVLANGEPTADAFTAALVAVTTSQVGNNADAFAGWLDARLGLATTTLFLDGLDEIPEPDIDRLERKARFLEALAAFAGTSRARVYLTARPYDIPDLTSMPFTLLGLRGFDTDQIAAFTRTALGPVAGAQFTASLHGRTAELAHVPVMLSFLCVLHRHVPSSAAVPRRYDLFREMLDCLVSAAWRHAPNAARRRERVRDALPALAWSLLSDSWNTRFSSRQLGTVLGESLADDVRHAGIVVPQADRLAFVHQSIAEHLVAAYLAEDCPTPDRYVDQHMNDPAWKEVWPQYAGAVCADHGRLTAFFTQLLDGGASEVAGECLVDVVDSVDPSTRDRTIGDLLGKLRMPHSRVGSTLRSLGSTAVAPLAATIRDESRPWASRVAATVLLRYRTEPAAIDALAYAARSSVPAVMAASEPDLTPPVPPEQVSRLLASFARHHPGASHELILRACQRANDFHRDQFRYSADPYATHPLIVARVVADLGYDEPTIAAALLHDVLEDTEVSAVQLEAEFGADVTRIVQRVSEVYGIAESPDDLTLDSLQAWWDSTGDDPRVAAVKLADRLHNLRTIATLPRQSQRAAGLETLALHVTAADQLGHHRLARELEDLARAAVDPHTYADEILGGLGGASQSERAVSRELRGSARHGEHR
jgi:hypothetical protein